MSTPADKTYKVVKDAKNDDVLCPVDSSDTHHDQTFDECVEKDVVERYSGNITVGSNDADNG